VIDKGSFFTVVFLLGIFRKRSLPSLTENVELFSSFSPLGIFRKRSLPSLTENVHLKV